MTPVYLLVAPSATACHSEGEVRAAVVAERLECGTAFVNDHLTLQPYMPFGGMKWSGIGVENGPWGLEEFTALQVLYRARG